jgi:hypothetical protein
MDCDDEGKMIKLASPRIPVGSTVLGCNLSTFVRFLWFPLMNVLNQLLLGLLLGVSDRKLSESIIDVDATASLVMN